MSPYSGLNNRSLPLQYSCLENSMDRGAWYAAVHEVAKSRTERLTHYLSCRLPVAQLSSGPGWLLLPLSFLPREPVTLPWAHCVLGGLPRAPSAQACATSPLSWNSRHKNKTDSLSTPQLFPASFFRLPLWHCFPRNYEAMKLLKNSNTVHGLFIKKTIIEKRSCKFAW